MRGETLSKIGCKLMTVSNSSTRCVARIIVNGVLWSSLVAWVAVGAGCLLEWLLFGSVIERGRHLIDRKVSLKLGAALLAERSAVQKDHFTRESLPEGLKAAFEHEQFSYMMPFEDGVLVEYGGGFHHLGLKVVPISSDLWMLQFYDEIQFSDMIGAEKVMAIWQYKPPASPILIWSR